MIRGVLFDLDGTLLDIDIDDFLTRYFAALEVAAQEFVGSSATHEDVMGAIMSGTTAMMRAHPGETNREAFYRVFLDETGLDLAVGWPVFERFYTDVFPTLRDGLGPTPGAHQALDAAEMCGLKVAIATNPIFPRLAIEHRLSWAGVDPLRADVITDYETMCSCKPSAEYFRQTARMLDLDPVECLMVGDDRVLDLAAADVGMKTFYVGSEIGTSADYAGDLTDLASLLKRTCGAAEG